MKRFYKQAGIASAVDGHRVTLDGKPIRTPAKVEMVLPTAALAEAIAAEWQAQAEEIRPGDMPLTQLAATAIDRVSKERAAVIEELVGYAETDLLCYHAEEPEDLVARQVATWQPLLDWANETFEAPFQVTAGIMPARQPEPALIGVRRALDALSDLELTALASLTASCGSLIVALAVRHGRISAEEAFSTSQLDETFQIEQWGEDEEARKRRALLMRDIEAATLFLSLCRLS
ncbi:ATP12 family chaperone protein [Oceanibaculum indicum]|uniref:Chaperone required for assembly of F1-ATPase n=1 Tax=Oceanibaculum indicum TaxID=526216 RepID=A0A420WS17_9PROT|nr:ATP12 family protein [Oceanibaculum indicum]RKQ73779.1 chaperone required for assembly of F1-ATPase [Oceanibaculum indicum]